MHPRIDLFEPVQNLRGRYFDIVWQTDEYVISRVANNRRELSVQWLYFYRLPIYAWIVFVCTNYSPFLFDPCLRDLS